jgi:transposase
MKITNATRERIRILSGAGMQQKDVAKELGLCRASVSTIQKQLNMSPYSREPISRGTENKVMELFKQGFGAPSIAAELGIAMHRVYQVKDAHQCKARRHKGERELRAIRREIRRSEDEIAKRFNVSHAWLRRFRRRMWATK